MVLRTSDKLQDRSIYSRDGRFLGKAVSFDDGWFKLDTPNAPDYWLPLETIREVVEGQVVLRIDWAAVRKERRHEPPEAARRRFERESEPDPAQDARDA